MKVSLSIRVSITVLILALAPVSLAQRTQIRPQRLAPYVPSPPQVVEEMLKLAGVTEKDTVYDLGSGDGRIVITAAQQFGARAVGIEIDEKLVEETQARLRKLNLSNRVEIIKQDAMTVDLGPASVVTLYLLTSSNEMLRPNLEKTLKPGSRVVSHDFRISGWKPTRTEVIHGDARTHTIYLYEVGKQ